MTQKESQCIRECEVLEFCRGLYCKMLKGSMGTHCREAISYPGEPVDRSEDGVLFFKSHTCVHELESPSGLVYQGWGLGSHPCPQDGLVDRVTKPFKTKTASRVPSPWPSAACPLMLWQPWLISSSVDQAHVVYFQA